MNKHLYRVTMPLKAEYKVYTPKECISAIIQAHNASSGLGVIDDRFVASVATALSGDDYDYCIQHAGFDECTISEYQAFKEDFLATNWVAYYIATCA